MSEAIQVTPTVLVPSEAIAMKAVRAGGPGGQNVNKVASKVELRIRIEAIQGLSPGALERLRAMVRNRLDADGAWIITSSRTRDQIKNIEDARLKAAAVIAEALVPPIIRQATRPTRSSQRRRVDDKRRNAEKKKGRGGNFE